MDKGILLHRCEQAQVRLKMLEDLAENLRSERDSVFQQAIAQGVSVHALSRLVGLSRQSIMRIRDLDIPEPYVLPTGVLGTLEDELEIYYDGQPYDDSPPETRTLL